MKLPIFLDNHSTTPMDPRVLETMLPYFVEKFGNAASRNHAFGWAAEEAIEQARKQIAKLIKADPKEIVFTSGATESDNLAIKGVLEMYKEKGDHIITSSTEHRAVLDTVKSLEGKGKGTVTYLPVDKFGMVNPEDVRNAITAKTILISVMLANNEIGTINPVKEIGKIAKEKGILFHCDATQGVGKIPVDVQEMGIDLMSFSAHKMYGPKGVGALYVRKKNPRVRIAAQMDGGGHERGMRSGTLPVPLIVGFGKACELCEQEMAKDTTRLIAMRDRLEASIMKALEESYLNGERPRLGEARFGETRGVGLVLRAEHRLGGVHVRPGVVRGGGDDGVERGRRAGRVPAAGEHFALLSSEIGRPLPVVVRRVVCGPVGQ